MTIKLHTASHGPILLHDQLPSSFGDLRLPGSRAASSVTELGSVYIQEVYDDHYSIRYSIFHFLKKITIFFREDRVGLSIHLPLQGLFEIKAGRKQLIRLREGEYLFGNVVDRDSTSFQFDKGKEYKLFNTHYSPDLVGRIAASFPALAEFAGNEPLKPASGLVLHGTAPPGSTRLAYDILTSPYSEPFRRFHFENKVRDLLFELLAHAYHADVAGIRGVKDKEALLQARDLVLRDLRKHYSIREISKIVQLNEYKLKTGFSELFGSGIFEVLLQARMENARGLLLETDKPIKEIASLTGYQHLTSFITSFRKYFGYTPGSLRRH